MVNKAVQVGRCGLKVQSKARPRRPDTNATDNPEETPAPGPKDTRAKHDDLRRQAADAVLTSAPWKRRQKARAGAREPAKDGVSEGSARTTTTSANPVASMTPLPTTTTSRQDEATGKNAAASSTPSKPPSKVPYTAAGADPQEEIMELRFDQLQEMQRSAASRRHSVIQRARIQQQQNASSSTDVADASLSHAPTTVSNASSAYMKKRPPYAALSCLACFILCGYIAPVTGLYMVLLMYWWTFAGIVPARSAPLAIVARCLRGAYKMQCPLIHIFLSGPVILWMVIYLLQEFWSQIHSCLAETCSRSYTDNAKNKARYARPRTAVPNLPSWPLQQPAQSVTPIQSSDVGVVTLNVGGLSKEGYDELAQWLNQPSTLRNVQIVFLQETWRSASEFSTQHWHWILSGAGQTAKANNGSGVAVLINNKLASSSHIRYQEWLPGRLLEVRITEDQPVDAIMHPMHIDAILRHGSKDLFPGTHLGSRPHVRSFADIPLGLHFVLPFIYGVLIGVRQGCMLAPCLWLLFVTYLFHHLDTTMGGAASWTCQHSTAFADDLHFKWDLDDPKALDRMKMEVATVLSVLKSFGLQISAEKSTMLIEIRGTAADVWLSKNVYKDDENNKHFRYDTFAKLSIPLGTQFKLPYTIPVFVAFCKDAGASAGINDFDSGKAHKILAPKRELPQDRSVYSINGLPQCRFCGYKFTKWSGLQRHIQRNGCPILRHEDPATFAATAPATTNKAEDPLRTTQHAWVADSTIATTMPSTGDQPLVQDAQLQQDASKYTWTKVLHMWRTKHDFKNVCVFCGQWAVDASALKQHYAKQHQALTNPWIAAYRAECKQLAKVAVEMEDMPDFDADSQIQSLLGGLSSVVDLKPLLNPTPTPARNQSHLTNKRPRAEQWTRGTGSKGGGKGKGVASNGTLSQEDLQQLLRQIVVLLLRQGDQLNRLQTDTGYYLVFQVPGDATMVPVLIAGALEWRNQKKADPTKLTMSLRIALIGLFLKELQMRLGKIRANDQLQEKLKEQGLMTDEGAWTYRQWCPKNKALQLQLSRDPIKWDVLMTHITNALQGLNNQDHITRFQATKALEEGQMGPTLPFLLDISLKPSACRLHQSMRALVDCSAMEAVGARIRPQRAKRSQLQDQLQEWLRGRFYHALFQILCFICQHGLKLLCLPDHTAFQALIQEWPHFDRQQDVAEFAQHVLDRTWPVQNVLPMSTWQSRDESGFSTDEGQHLIMLPMPSRGSNSEIQLSGLIQAWAQQSPAPGLWPLPRFVCLQLLRFYTVGARVRKDQRAVTIPLQVRLPVFQTEIGPRPAWRMYRLRALIGHHGSTPRSGHYRTLLIHWESTQEDPQLYYTDDSCMARRPTNAQLRVLMTEVYLVFLECVGYVSSL
ncbi:unnamed protein product [Symbiodinium sp. CCMP2592]|nr:unnamed protein product [Symbiodinium sp. CCMP2592]